MTTIEHAALAVEIRSLLEGMTVLSEIHEAMDGKTVRADIPESFHRDFHSVGHSLVSMADAAIEDAIKRHGNEFAAKHYVRNGDVLGGLSGPGIHDLIAAANKYSAIKYCPRCRSVMGAHETVTGALCCDCEVELG